MSETKSYKIIGHFYSHEKGSVITANAKDVEASNLLGATLEEIPDGAVSEEVPQPSDGEGAGGGQTPPTPKPAAPATPKPAGGPPMPGKAAVTPVPGK